MVIDNNTIRAAARQRCRTIVFIAALAATFTSFARAPNYVSVSEVSLELILPPPPAAGSPAEKADLQAVLDVQQRRTEAQAQAAKDDAQLSAFRVADMLGPNFTPEKLPFTAQFLRRALTDSGDNIAAAKAHFNRPRPFLVDATVQPVVGRTGGASYPSGHATFAYVAGILLSAMVPERAAEISARADVYARNRVVAGVHFPTDVEAGRISASVLANVFLHDEQFMADFKAAKAEVRQALGMK